MSYEEYQKAIESLKDESASVKEQLIPTLADQFNVPIILLRKDLGLAETKEDYFRASALLDPLIKFTEEKRFKLGFSTLDAIIGGIPKKRYVLVAGRTRVGKTSFLLNAAKNLSEDGATVLFFSLEMSKEEITQRLLQIVGATDRRNLFSLIKIGGAESLFKKFIKSCKNLIICDKSTLSVADMRILYSKISEELKTKIDVVCIDYLSLIIPPKQTISLGGYQTTVLISRELLSFAKELDCVVLCATQCNRGGEKSKLSITNILNAGENDANVVLGLQRDSFDDDQTVYYVECSVLKNRDGRAGRVTFLVEGSKFLWREI